VGSSVGFTDDTDSLGEGVMLESEPAQAEVPTRVESKIAMTAKGFMTHPRINHPILGNGPGSCHWFRRPHIQFLRKCPRARRDCYGNGLPALPGAR
jgi:hypothetical protein